MSAPAISCDGLTKKFGSFVAVDDLQFAVQPGAIAGFLGPNGAGKSTTIRMLMGFLRPSAGTCTILGETAASSVDVRRRVGFLPGDFRMDPSMTGSQLFRWFGELRGGTNAKRVDELVQRFSLDPSRPFNSLSKGNRQKIGLIQAFQHDPDVLILDEPTSGLDPLLQQEFLNLLDEVANAGAAVLFSSHALHEVEQVAQNVVIIRDGKLVQVSTIDEILDKVRHKLELRFGHAVPATLFDGVPHVVEADVSGVTATVLFDGEVGDAMRVAVNAAPLLRIRNVGDDLEELFLSLYKAGKND